MSKRRKMHLRPRQVRAFLSEVHHISNLYFMIFMMVSYFYMIFYLFH